MSIEARAQRIIDAIEATPAAVLARSQALALYRAGPAEHVDEIVDLCRDATDAVLVAHPEIASDAPYLRPYIASQVRGLARGEDATLILPPLDQMN